MRLYGGSSVSNRPAVIQSGSDSVGSPLAWILAACGPTSACRRAGAGAPCDKSRPRPDVDQWTARPLDSVWRPPLKHDSLDGERRGLLG